METLSREDCFDLARRARAGDRAAEQRLIVCHLPLARIEASRFLSYAGADLDADDIRAQAELILVEQTRRYDPERGVPYRAWMAIQLRARVWNFVRPDRRRMHFATREGVRTDRRRLQQIANGDWVHEPTVESMEGAAAFDDDVRALVCELELDPELHLALGLVVSGLDAIEAQRRGIGPKRYAELRGKLRAFLSEE